MKLLSAWCIFVEHDSLRALELLNLHVWVGLGDEYAGTSFSPQVYDFLRLSGVLGVEVLPCLCVFRALLTHSPMEFGHRD